MEYSSLRDVHRRRKNRIAAPIGACVLILAIVGLVSFIIWGVRMTDRMLDKSGDKEMFARIVRPVMMLDPPPFEDVTTLPNELVLESALWATMLGDKRETYTFDAQGSLVVPSSDVDVSCARLFGPDVKLEHGYFYSDFGITYDFNETTRAYHVPVMSAPTMYTPRVDEIEHSGDIYSLLVGYIPPGTAWNTGLSGETEPDPQKYMVYKMQKVSNYFRLITIEDPPPEKQVRYTNVVSQEEIAGAGRSLPDDTEAYMPDEWISSSDAEEVLGVIDEEGTGTRDTDDESSDSDNNSENESESREDDSSSEEDTE